MQEFSIDVLRRALVGTRLADVEVGQWRMDGSPAPVWVLKLGKDDPVVDWELLRSLVPVTARYPLLATANELECWQMAEAEAQHESESEDEDEDEADEDAEEGDDDFNDSRQSAIEDSLDVDLDDATEGSAETSELDALVAGGHFLLERLHERCGVSPEVAEIVALRAAGELRNDVDLHWWLLQWELARNGELAATWDPSYLAWHEVDNRDAELVAVLLPTPHAWQALAYSPWYGYYTEDEAQQLAQLRRWEESYGAELVFASSVTVCLRVTRRPSTLEEAFELAKEHERFSPSLPHTSGISIGENARGLLSTDRWTFFEDP